MKKFRLHIVLFTSLIMGASACKNDKQNLAEATGNSDSSISIEDSEKFMIDPNSSEIKWKGSKPTGAHVGTIQIENGHLFADSEEITGGNVLIDMTSITVTDEGMSEDKRTSLENHLKGTVDGKETHFFDVKKYPTAAFEITGFTEENSQTILQGNLTIKEDTKNINIPVKTSIADDEILLESETFTIDRTDWKVNYKSNSVFENLGDSFINDDIELTISVRAKK